MTVNLGTLGQRAQDILDSGEGFHMANLWMDVHCEDVLALVAAVRAADEFFDSMWAAYLDWQEMPTKDREDLQSLIDDCDAALAPFRTDKEPG